MLGTCDREGLPPGRPPRSVVDPEGRVRRRLEHRAGAHSGLEGRRLNRAAGQETVEIHGEALAVALADEDDRDRPGARGRPRPAGRRGRSSRCAVLPLPETPRRSPRRRARAATPGPAARRRAGSTPPAPVEPCRPPHPAPHSRRRGSTRGRALRLPSLRRGSPSRGPRPIRAGTIAAWMRPSPRREHPPPRQRGRARARCCWPSRAGESPPAARDVRRGSPAPPRRFRRRLPPRSGRPVARAGPPSPRRPLSRTRGCVPRSGSARSGHLLSARRHPLRGCGSGRRASGRK